jgi:ribonucleoside-triphosphate reductase (thioredoxin)
MTGRKEEKDKEILSEITIFNKYAKYIPEENRRETWEEICNRYRDMLLSKYPNLRDQILGAMPYVLDKKILPSMRAMQFAGPAIMKNESRVYNCAFVPVDSYQVFSETMFLLLGGTGVGYSVQNHHVDRLPEITKPTKERKYVVSDSLEGWADAIKVLMKAYFGITQYKPKFNYSDIRQKGARLVTAGGKAPGPRPLMECVAKIEGLLQSKENGDKLRPIECHDIMCYIANAVLSGGIRKHNCGATE